MISASMTTVVMMPENPIINQSISLVLLGFLFGVLSLIL